jgi:hypothetical protein
MEKAGATARVLAVVLALCAGAGCGLAPPEEPGPAPTDPTPPPPPPPADLLPPPGYVLAWAEDFDGVALDRTQWTPLDERRRDATATPEAVRVENGIARFTTYTEGGVHHTGFIGTVGKFEATYGYFEAKIRFHSAPGAWCAFWLDSPTIGRPLGDPGTAGVEIDVVEHRVTDRNGWDALADMVALNLNWDGYDRNKKNRQKVLPLADGAPVQGEWHVFAVDWTPEGYTFYVDELPLWAISEAVSHRSEGLRLTCEVDDASWAGYVPDGGYGPLATSTTGMDVDWVRVWQLPDDVER